MKFVSCSECFIARQSKKTSIVEGKRVCGKCKAVRRGVFQNKVPEY